MKKNVKCSEDEEDDENDGEEDDEQELEEEETTVRASRREVLSISKKVSSSSSLSSSSSGNKKRAASEISNNLGRFGFSVLGNEAAAKLAKNSIDDSRPRRNAGQHSVRSSSRIATTVEKKQSEEDSSPDNITRAVRTSKRSSRLKIEESDEEESSTCVRKSSRARSFSTGYADPHSDDEFYGGRAPELKKSSKGKKEEVKSTTKSKTIVKADSDSGESDDDIGAKIVENLESGEPSSDASSEGSREEEEGDDEDAMSENNSEENGGDDVEYKIQQILSRQSMTPAMWQAICGPMNTR